MRRREFIVGAGLLTASLPMRAASDEAKRPLIGVLVAGSEAASDRYRSGFKKGIEELGYLIGKDIDVVYRYADGDALRLPGLAEELVRLRPDIILAGTQAGVLAAKQVAPITPIVSVFLVAPERFGLAESQSRPGGNVTGILNTVETLPGKQIELALKTLPGADRIGLVQKAESSLRVFYQHSSEATARILGVQLVQFDVHSSDDFDQVFRSLAEEQVKITVMAQDLLFLNKRQRIAEIALAARMPTVFSVRENVEAGGLISYGVNLRESWRRSAFYVDKILKGARPGDLPIEFPAKLELVINLKTAKALGLTISPLMLARADEVIE